MFVLDENFHKKRNFQNTEFYENWLRWNIIDTKLFNEIFIRIELNLNKNEDNGIASSIINIIYMEKLLTKIGRFDLIIQKLISKVKSQKIEKI